MIRSEFKREMTSLVAILVAPAALLTNLLIAFVLAPWACANHWEPALFVTHVVFLLITAAAGWTAWMEWGRAGREWQDEAPDAPGRARFLAIMGVLISALCCLQIIGTIIFSATLGACE